MKNLFEKNLNEEDRNEAIKQLRLLVKGIPIEDENGELIGFIEKPDLNAIKFVLEKTESSEW